MRADRVIAALVMALVCGACASADSDPSREPLGEALSSSTEAATARLKNELDVWIDQNLPKWDIYMAGVSRHYVHPGVWAYYDNPYDLDDQAAVIAVPRGKESDASSWVQFSATKFIAKGDRYFISLLDKISLLDLIAIEKALEAAPDDPPIIGAPLGSAAGRLEEDPPGVWWPSLSPDWGSAPPGGGRGHGGHAVAPPQQPHPRQPPPQGGPDPWAWPRPGGPRRAPTPRATDPFWPAPNTPPVQQWRAPVGKFFGDLMKELARLPEAPAEASEDFRHSPNCLGWCNVVVHYGPRLLHACGLLLHAAEGDPGIASTVLEVPVVGDVAGGVMAACAAMGALRLSVQAGAFVLEEGDWRSEQQTGEDYCHRFCLTPTW